MRRAFLAAALILLLAAVVLPAGAVDVGKGLAPEDSLRLLKEGNSRYQDGKMQHPHAGPDRRALTAAQGQHPLAVILTCSDSRVPPELIFDQGIGDLFVVRVAGNVAAGTQVGSIEFAVDRLGAPLVVVLGHTQCGEVAAALAGESQPPNIAALLDLIKHAVDKAKEDNPEASKENLLNDATRNNVWLAVTDLLEQSPIIKEKVKEKKVQVIGAIYEIDRGQVQWLGTQPDQVRPSAKKGKK